MAEAWTTHYTHEMMNDHRALVREATLHMGYPVCGKPLGFGQVCHMSKWHSGTHS